ncbi:MAG: terpene cyclase/mutase family protein [Coriobacteriia bacterium]|nr:terpene cyclase/mutase family protein [Coriobacteriia bacterium]
MEFDCRKNRRKKTTALMIMLVFCISLLPYGAWTEVAVAGSGDGEATLTIVFGLGLDGSPDVAVNKTYSFEEGATIEDLLDAAVVAGDLTGYALDSGGFPHYFTKTGGTTLQNASNFATYWATFIDGGYFTGSGNLRTIKLVDGSAYQFAWDSFPTATAPSWNLLDPPDIDIWDVVGGGAAVGRATATVVYGIDSTDMPMFAGPGLPIVITNISYEFSDGATVADFFELLEEDGEINSYTFDSNGYLSSLSFYGGIFSATNAADFSTYWSTYVNGDYFGGGTGGIEATELQDGYVYQFAWESFPTATPPQWNTIPAPTPGGGSAHGGTGGLPDTPPASLPGSAQATFNTLLANISTRFAYTGDDWKALSMAAIGNADAVNQNAIIANAVAAYNDPDATNLQRSILAVTALGIDARNVVSDNTSYNLIEALANSSTSFSGPNAQMFALLAYASGPYVPSVTSNPGVEELIDNILAAQNTDGGWTWFGSTSDVDMTAMGILALEPYRADDPRIEEAIQTALVTLYDMQAEHGGFESMWNPGEIDVSSTAMAIIALSAIGVDTQSWVVGAGAHLPTCPHRAPEHSLVAALDAAFEAMRSTIQISVAGASTGAQTPLSALLSQANTSLTGFLFNGATNDMATEQGFLALVSYQGFLNTGQPFNIYTQARSGAATFPINVTTDTTNTIVVESAVLDVDSSNGVNPVTGDNLLPLMMALLVLAIGSSFLVAGTARRTALHPLGQREHGDI